MKFVEFYNNMISEMALTDMQKVGKWEDTKNKHGYDKQSIGIINSPAGWEKIKQKFDNINLADFNLYFVKDTNAWKHRETGKQRPESIKWKTGLDLSSQEKHDPDAVTVVFTNNSASEKVPLTPWTIAHRIGHTFIRSYRQGGRDADFEYLYGRFEDAVTKILREGYGVRDSRGGGFNPIGTPLYRNLFESLGTFRSARMKKLNRPQEFLYECFAQWLLSNGFIKFNDLPNTLLGSNKKAWGNPVGMSYRLKPDADSDDLVGNLEGALGNLFYYWVESHKGTTSIM